MIKKIISTYFFSLLFLKASTLLASGTFLPPPPPPKPKEIKCQGESAATNPECATKKTDEEK